MPMIERIEGAPMEMKRAAIGIVSSFSIKRNNQQRVVAVVRMGCTSPVREK